MKKRFPIGEIKWIVIGIAMLAFLVFLHTIDVTNEEAYVVTAISSLLFALTITFYYLFFLWISPDDTEFSQKNVELAKHNPLLHIYFGPKRCRVELDRAFEGAVGSMGSEDQVAYGYQCFTGGDEEHTGKPTIQDTMHREVSKDDDIVIRDTKHDYHVNIDIEGKIIYVSDATSELFLKSKRSILNKNISTLQDVFGINSDQWFTDIKTRYRSQSTAEVETNDGKKWLYWDFEAVTDVFGSVLMITATGHEITNLINMKQQTNPNHTFDFQTNLINQQGLYEKIASLKNVNRAVCFFIDFWNFSKISDFYGHRIHDEIIVMIADQLRRCEGKNCLVCRFSNSKFVVMLFGKQTSDSVIATKLANLDNYLPKVYQLEENLIQIEKRIGYAVYPDDTDSLEKLISLASLAMKESKQENHFKVIRYKKTMGETLKKNIAISVNLKHALETGMVEVFFQKAIDAFTGNVVYLEELARWKDGTLGYISPVEMFAAAKEANMVEQLDKHLVEEAIRQFAYLRNSGEYPSAKLAINIAPSSLMDPMFTTFIREQASKYSVKPRDICIEISESAFVNSLEACIERIKDYKKLGFQIALDDFGKDYSSLAILESVPFDIIKIDKLFIAKIQDGKNREIIKMIRNITNLYRKEIIVEGVETEAQRKCLLELGCVIQQGFFHHKPEKLV
ncbi:MAG: EAL domain-containing protein [Candidatus Izemoplasmatales bacterium]|jgi:diguanylate cyclase (GGDEF)-like protein